MKTFSQMAGLAADPAVELGTVRNASPMVHAILALILLLVATVLAVYKPLGMTAYGRRKQNDQASSAGSSTSARPARVRAMTMSTTPPWIYLPGMVALGLLLLFGLLHLAGTDLRH